MLKENYGNVISEIHVWGPLQDKTLAFLKTIKNSKKKKREIEVNLEHWLFFKSRIDEIGVYVSENIPTNCKI